MNKKVGESRQKVVRTLHAVLEQDNSLSRCCAVRALAKLNARDKKSRQSLIGLLRDPDPDVRTDAAVALGQMRVANAVAPLLGNLENDPEGDVRIEAVKALSTIRSKKAVEPLIRCFEADGYPELDNVVDDLEYGPWWEVQSQALDALGAIGDQRATEPVIEMLRNDDYEDLQESGFRVLAQLNNNKTKTFLLTQLKEGRPLARRRAAQALGVRRELGGETKNLPSDVANALTSALVDRDASVRMYAARALAESRSPQAVVPLTLLLTDPDLEVRKEIAALLGRMRGKTVLDRLHPLLAEPDPGLKRRVARLLGDIGDPTSVAPLSVLLETEDGDLLYEVVSALGKIGRPGPQERLATILANKEVHGTVRSQAAWALGRILGKARADKHIRKRKKKVRECVPEEVLADAVFARDEQVSYAALNALVEMDPKKAVRRLIALLQATTQVDLARAQRKAVEALPDSGKASKKREQPQGELPKELEELVASHSAQTSTLASMLADQAQGAQVATEHTTKPVQRVSANSVRILAARLLGNVPNPGAAAVTALRKAFNEGDSALGKEALLALGRIGDTKGLPTVLKGLDADDEAVKLAALEALNGFSNVAGIVERLAKLCEDPDPNIRVRAVRALRVGRGKRVADALRRALEDDNLEVCRAALAALSKKTYTPECGDHVVNVMFRFSGELRGEAAATLKRLNDYSAAPWLLDTLNDAAQEEWHWVCIDALAEMYAQTPITANTAN